MNAAAQLQAEDWTCRVCGAAHPAPVAQCRRCGAALLPFARLAAEARCRPEAATFLDGGAKPGDSTGKALASGRRETQE